MVLARDVAVVGAGLAGIVCAQSLQQAGCKVVILEKSRGIGGRVATRRIDDTAVDHGLPYLEEQGERSQALIEQLQAQHLLQTWTDKIYDFRPQLGLSPLATKKCYIASQGITAIAKWMAAELDIWRPCRVRAIAYRQTSQPTWSLTLEGTGDTLNAKAIVLAIPAPQALPILAPLASTIPDYLDTLRSVIFDPCITVMAGYPAQYQQELLDQSNAWQAVRIGDRDLAWTSLDSSKREATKQPVFVLHSTAGFAQSHLDTAVQPVGEKLLARASQLLLPWLARPDWYQVHRWRYAFPSQPLSALCLATSQPLPLVCCGDWCEAPEEQARGRNERKLSRSPSSFNERNHVESALKSGLAAAEEIIKRPC